MSHVRPEDALTMVALPSTDAERRAAYDHAASCADCAALLREHELMLRFVDASFAPAAVSAALAARVQAQVYSRRWPRLVVLAIGLASLALVFAVDRTSNALSAVIGSHCALTEAVFAVAPLGVAAWLSRAGRVRIDPVGFAALAGGGGLAAQWLLREYCPVHGATLHAFVFHFLVVLALSVLGGLIGQRILARAA
jgi:hypothetical protein